MRGRRLVRKVIEEHFASFRKSQRETLAALTLGLVRTRRLGLASIARGMGTATTVRHRIKRVWRFARNTGVCHEKAGRALIGWLCSPKARSVIALDWTYFGPYAMLAASLIVAGRAVPLAWTVVHKRKAFTKKRRSQNQIEERFLERLREAMGTRPWVLVADRGFARASLIAKLQQWHIDYVIRGCGGTWVQGRGLSGVLDNVPRPRGTQRIYRSVHYHKQRRLRVNLAVTHAEPAPEPWYLLTSLDRARDAVRVYRQRMGIEEGFRDLKSGLGLKGLWLSQARRVERLMIVAAVATALAVLRALQWRRRHGAKDPQLSTKRKGAVLSYFKMGLELMRQGDIPRRLHPAHALLALAEAL